MEQPKFVPQATKEDELHPGEIYKPEQTMDQYREELDRYQRGQTMEGYSDMVAEREKAQTIEAQLAEIRDRLFSFGKHSPRTQEGSQAADAKREHEQA